MTEGEVRFLSAVWAAHGIRRSAGRNAMADGGFSADQVHRYRIPVWLCDVTASPDTFFAAWNGLTSPQRETLAALSTTWTDTLADLVAAARLLAPVEA